MKKLLFMLLVMVSVAGAQGVRYSTQVQDTTGRKVSSPVVRLCSEPATGLTCIPLAAGLFSDRALTQPLANPFTGDINGNVGFYVAPGRYHAQVSGNGIVSFDVPDIVLSDPSLPYAGFVSVVPSTAPANQFATGVSAAGVVLYAQPAFSNILGTLSLTGAVFASQGSTSTLLHGNGGGNLSFSSVALTTDVSGVLIQANGGTGVNSTAIFPGSGIVNTGSGTTNSLIKFTTGASGILGNSSLVDNGTTVSTSEPVLLGSSLGVTGVQTNTNVDGVRFADGFSGTGATEINNAENDCSTTNCLVIVPATVASGAGQSLLTKDNVFVWDMRSFTSSAQAQGNNLSFNVKDTANGAVRSKLMLVDPVQPTSVMTAPNSSASWYVHTFAEGNLAGYGTIEATNGTVTVDTGTTGSPGAAVGVEAECFVSGTAANTITSCRGGTYNVGLTGAGSITNAVAIQAQAAINTGSGTIANAIGGLFENQTVGTSANLGIWDQGNAAFDKPISLGNFAGGITPQAFAMLFVRPQSGQLTGGTQVGIQSAPITSSGATASGVGILSRADLGSAFTQGQNTAFEAQTPSLNGGTVTRYTAFKADAPPVAGTVCLFEFGGATSGSTCLNATAVASGTAVLPAASGTVLVTGNGSTPVQTKRGTAGCATAAAIGATCTITVSWTTAFADTNYTVTGCTGNAITSGVPLMQGITGKATGTITVQTVAMTAVAAQFTNVECGAIHD